MNDPEFQKAYEAQNRRDYITGATVGTFVSIPLNLSCVVMDHFMYPGPKTELFFKARLCSVIVSAAAWFWFKTAAGRAHPQVSAAWYLSPLIMILWMIYAADDASAPYYAGLNIILLGVGLLTPWAYLQNISITVFVMVMYVIISFAQPTKSLINNTTFLMLTSALVVSGSVANARQRLREFTLRWELDKSRREIEASNQKLKELDEIKSRFFANISHELRTPLTLLIAPLENLMQRFARSTRRADAPSQQVDEDTRNLLHTMQANGMRLLKLINDLLDLVRLESGVMVVRRDNVPVVEFVTGLASAVRQVADDKRIKLETHVDAGLAEITADRDKLEKIVLNLLFNALKFTPAGGRVELRAEKQGEEFVLIVNDTGMGIAAKNLPNVFDRFWQADGSSKRKYQGVGIGLALVKELTEVQNGKVNVTSVEGQGTTFTVRLPYQAAETPLAAEKSSETEMLRGSQDSRTVTSQEWLSNLYRRAELFPSMTPVQDALKPVETSLEAGRLTVLVADDEPDMLRFLKSQLSVHYRVFEAVDGQQAVDKAAQFLPDIVLLDMMMPEKDGLQACREIRGRTSTQTIPVILLTARADEETKLASLEAGASDFLSKPFSTTELHVRIRNLVESHQYQIKLGKQNQILEATVEQLKETELQLVQTEKLASLGRMSAGIIHEINNPLNFANTGLFTLRDLGKNLPAGEQPEYAEILKDIEDGISRVRTIVSDLRSFTHHDGGQVDPVEVAEVLKSSLRFLSHEFGNKIRLEQELPPDQIIWANKNKLIQVCVNVLQNSLDALKEKTFEAGEVPTIRITGRVENGRSQLLFRDNGNGIPREHLDKIFDPFFTTKDVGQGMGLGLSLSYRMVQDYDGRMLVKSEPGRFTEFTLDFPNKPLTDGHETTMRSATVPVAVPSNVSETSATLGATPVGAGGMPVLR